MAPRLPSRCWAHLPRPSPSSNTTILNLALQLERCSIKQPCLLLPRTARRTVTYGWSNTLPKRGAKAAKYDAMCPGLPALTATPAAALARKIDTTPLRTGILATKKGMTAFYSRRGTRIPCTILQLDSNQVVANKNFKKHGYWAVQVGAGSNVKSYNVPAPLLGYYEAKGVPPKQHLQEFKVRGEEGLLPVGTHLQPDWFHVGQWVDVRSNSRGMGFEGGMKRHGFAGQEASHGNSKNHRTGGSSGPSQGGGSRVLPGKKMPGRMGNERVTCQNLSILQVDNEKGVVLVKGSVGGPKGALVMLSDAVKKPDPEKKFVESTAAAVAQRQPDLAERLHAARRKHLVLRSMRKDKTMADFLQNGMEGAKDRPRREAVAEASV